MKTPTFEDLQSAIRHFNRIANLSPSQIKKLEKRDRERVLWNSSLNGTYVKKLHGEFK